MGQISTKNYYHFQNLKLCFFIHSFIHSINIHQVFKTYQRLCKMDEEEGYNRTKSDRQKQKVTSGAHWRVVKSRLSSNTGGNKIGPADTWSASWRTHWNYLETGRRSLAVFVLFLMKDKILSLWLAKYLWHNIWVPGIDTETASRIKTKWFLSREKAETSHQHFLIVGIMEVPSYLPASAFTTLFYNIVCKTIL